MTKIDYRAITPVDLDGVIDLCRAEGWPSFIESKEKTWNILTAPGVTTIVALDEDVVVGFAQMQSDGVVQAHLSTIAVRRDRRGLGIGRQLIEEAFSKTGGIRVDLISTEGSDAFYESFEHRRFAGFRIYPGGPERSG